MASGDGAIEAAASGFLQGDDVIQMIEEGLQQVVDVSSGGISFLRLIPLQVVGRIRLQDLQGSGEEEVKIRIIANASTTVVTIVCRAANLSRFIPIPRGYVVPGSSLVELAKRIIGRKSAFQIWDGSRRGFLEAIHPLENSVEMLDWTVELNILQRLPLEDLARLRCVSKAWKARVLRYIRHRPEMTHTTLIFQAKSERAAFQQLVHLLSFEASRKITLPMRLGEDSHTENANLLRRHSVIAHSGHHLLVELQKPGDYAIFEPLKNLFWHLPELKISPPAEPSTSRGVVGAIWGIDLVCLIDVFEGWVELVDSKLGWIRSEVSFDNLLTGIWSRDLLEAAVISTGNSPRIALLDLVGLDVVLLELGRNPEQGNVLRVIHGSVIHPPWEAATGHFGLAYFTEKKRVRIVEIWPDRQYVLWDLDVERGDWVPSGPEWSQAPEKLHRNIARGNRGASVALGARSNVGRVNRVSQREWEVMFFVGGNSEIHCYNLEMREWGIRRLPNRGVPDRDALVLGHLIF